MYGRRAAMQKTKLTVRIPQEVLENFKQYAKEKNTTMTSLVETYLRRIPDQELPANAPITRRLSGTLSQQVSIEDHKKHLVEKYGS
jgi:antitoxin component of RelBE/YafQ-DinJ toxin-antitoxin module